jgi:hypothetical protein
MTTKFLLTLLALNGLLLGANSASAYTTSTIENSHNIANLSRTIAKSIDLGGDYHSLMELAIDRALLAKGEKGRNSVDPEIAGGKSVQSERNPIVNGKIANPQNQPIKNGIILNPQQPNPPVNDNPRNDNRRR